MSAAMIEIVHRLGCRICVAFPGRDGTADCAARAERVGMGVRREG